MKFFILIFFLCCCGSIQSEWYSKNYTSPGYNLTRVEFVNEDIVFAVGENGTILKTLNGGDTWFRISLEEEKKLESVFFVSPDSGWICGEQGLVLRTTNCGEEWAEQETGLSNPITKIFFISPSTGWLLDETGKVKKSTDGGETWQFQSMYSDMRDIYFISSDNGFLCGDHLILKSTDGGASWEIKLNTNLTDFTSIVFQDQMDGFAIGSNQGSFGSMWMTFDGGENWEATGNAGLAKRCYQIINVDLNFSYWGGVGDISMHDEVNLLGKTSDGGMNWFYKSIENPAQQYMRSIDFATPEKGWAIGDGGRIFCTVDKGESWFKQEDGFGGNFLDVDFADDSLAWLVGGGYEKNYLMKSTNYGNNWQKETFEFAAKVLSVCALNEEAIWVSGTNGIIYFSPDGGATWLEQISGTALDLNQILFVSDTKGWAIGGTQDTNVVLFTNNIGMTWTQQKFDSVENLSAIFFINDSTGWISAAEGKTLFTKHSGSRWSGQYVGFPEDLRDIQFISESHGWTISKNMLFRTTNGGSQWERIWQNQAFIFSELHFVSENEGWIAGNNGSVFHTTDGGLNWQKEETGVTVLLKGIDFSQNGAGLIVGEEGTILLSPADTVIIVGTGEYIPSDYSLCQNYPNPFNPATKIKYSIPAGQKVELKIFDLLGREINTLVNEYKPAGHYEAEFDAGSLSSGVYLYRLTTGKYSETKKMLLIK